MINSVEQYEYVIGENVNEAHPHGDLDRIVIDGEVMPLRTGDTENFDKDGNAIPRTKIMRGEDIAFLIEAVAQRYSVNWCEAVYTWHRDTNGELVWYESTRPLQHGRFSRKICAANFSNPLGLSRKQKTLYELFDSLCDKSLRSISGLTPKVATSGNVITDYGLTGGIAESVRFFKNGTLPTRGDVLAETDTLIRYFITLDYLLCENLGSGFAATTQGFGIIIGYDHPDAVIVAKEGFDIETSYVGGLFGWGVHMEAFGSDISGGYRRSLWVIAPAPHVYFLKVRAPHLAQVVAVFRVVCQWGDGADNLLRTSTVWWPVTATKEGDVFTVKAEGNFDTREKTEKILKLAGWTQPNFPDDKESWLRSCTVRIQDVNLFGEWDDHTKWH